MNHLPCDVSVTQKGQLSFIFHLDMLTTLKIYHKQGGNHQGLELSSEGLWHFGTCMRSVVIAESNSSPVYLEDYELMTGEKAYGFLLEIICGLRSKLIGETEILGQFKEFCRINKKTFSRNLNDIVNALLKDSKSIRTEFLQNLGCQSYGSLLRKNLSDSDENLVFIGAGLLVKDILPWMNKSHLDLEVYTRDPKKHLDLREISEKVKLKKIEDISKKESGVLVIAAPVSKEWIDENVSLENFSMVYDLRGQSDQDSIEYHNYLSLNDFIGDIERNQIEAHRTKSNALKAISEKISEKSLFEKPRPFGWEDLWAYS